MWSAVGTRVARGPRRLRWPPCCACAGLAGLHLDNDPLAKVKGQPGSVTGAQVLAEHYPAGVMGPWTSWSRPVRRPPPRR